MIGKITGRVDYVAEDHALIEAAGVGYLVHCAAPTLARLAPGETAALYTELLVREDLMQLYGFATPAEREWHRLLTSVQGVGPRASMAILGALGPEGVGRAIALDDTSAIRRAPGIGPKLATRVVNELKGRAPDVLMRSVRTSLPDEAAPTETGAVAMPQPVAPVTSAAAEALSALANLGYDRQTAMRAIAAHDDGAMDVGRLIKAALRALDAERSA
ncbi:MAG: Holliday junction branch migration protein RuvA [Paracoccaceae bacterium]